MQGLDTLPGIQPTQPGEAPHQLKGTRNLRTTLDSGPATCQETQGMELGEFCLPRTPKRAFWEEFSREARAWGLVSTVPQIIVTPIVRS